MPLNFNDLAVPNQASNLVGRLLEVIVFLELLSEQTWSEEILARSFSHLI